MDASLSVNSKETYRIGLLVFDAFRNEYNYNVIWPPVITHVTTFVAYLSLKMRAYRTVNCYLSAINFRCKSMGHPGFSQNFIVQKMLEGLKRLNKPGDTRLPITEELLFRIIDKLPNICSSTFETHLFSSAFSLAYYGFFRVGELVLSKKWQAHQVVAIHNVTFAPQGGKEIIRIIVPFSKTDQYGQGATIEIAETGSKICPVFLLKNYLGQRPNVKGPLYCHFGGSYVTRYQFSCVLRKVFKYIGINNSASFRTHSFRIGAASSHFEKGTSEEEIKRLGRWKSNAYKSYIRS